MERGALLNTTITRRNLVGAGATAVAAGVLSAALPRWAFADPVEDARQHAMEAARQIAEARLHIDEIADSYHKAKEEYDAAQGAADQSRAVISENDAEIASLQEKLAHGMKAHYRSQSLGFVDVIMGSSSFSDLVTRWEQYDRLNESQSSMIAKAKSLKEQNEVEKRELEGREDEARKKFDECNALYTQAQSQINELQAMQDSLDDEFQALLDEAMAASLEEALKNIKIQITGNPNDLSPAFAALEFAKSRLGCPYVWAAEGPTSFDCSGLVRWCYLQMGIDVPHYTESQYELALSKGAVLDLKDVEPGDVLYRPGHVGIAAENGGTTYIHAPQTGDVVRYATWQQFVCGLRFAGAPKRTKEDEEKKKREEEEKKAAEEAKKAEQEQKEREQQQAQAEQQAQQQAQQQQPAQQQAQQQQPAQTPAQEQQAAPAAEQQAQPAAEPAQQQQAQTAEPSSSKQS